jgi:urease accessory protein UreH
MKAIWHELLKAIRHDPTQMKAIWMRNHLICMRIYDQRKAIIQCITHHIWMALKHQMGPINEHLMTTSMV